MRKKMVLSCYHCHLIVPITCNHSIALFMDLSRNMLIVLVTHGYLSHPGNTKSIYDIPTIVASCLPCAATPSNAIAGFKGTEIHPLDRKKFFTESDFAPGFITDLPLIVKETLHTIDSSLQELFQIMSPKRWTPCCSFMFKTFMLVCLYICSAGNKYYLFTLNGLQDTWH